MCIELYLRWYWLWNTKYSFFKWVQKLEAWPSKTIIRRKGALNLSVQWIKSWWSINITCIGMQININHYENLVCIQTFFIQKFQQQFLSERLLYTHWGFIDDLDGFWNIAENNTQSMAFITVEFLVTYITFVLNCSCVHVSKRLQ